MLAREGLISRAAAYVDEPIEAATAPYDQSTELPLALLEFYAEAARGLKGELVVLRSRLSNMEHSTSWRVTGPMRRVKRWIDRE